mgnify:FL=1
MSLAVEGPDDKYKYGVTESQMLTSKAEAAEGDLTDFKQVQDRVTCWQYTENGSDG